ncbi:hypothetical protein SmJEL517_g01809 [Synchytrium microbalum]|uniref:t-SNARE coiled-coil homology domain-containing protein n=1 Tax=Synchytrium microbalum TaxID=1806994 RepID=A0A507CD87_9FUNG|nr:uncharacterized protein SmJEL517_g01809 [Synchytrium microbalum]TPX35884.1 hypothetical protein SmJEL517_g01809 [Synchytrium microbalum]
MSEDPFFAVKDEVEASLNNANKLYQQWSRLVDSGSSNSDEVRWKVDELRSALQSIELDLHDLEGKLAWNTIKVVEVNPSKFRLDAREVGNRKDFITRTRRAIHELRSNLNDRQSKKPNQRTDDRSALLASRTNTDRFGRTQEDYKMSNQRHVDREQQAQSTIMAEQEDQMGDVLHTVTNLKDVAVVMGKELDDQTRLLEDLDTSVDNTQGRLRSAYKRMDEFIKANADPKQQCAICGLIIILIILLVIVVSF